jgi:hypothetical protein
MHSSRMACQRRFPKVNQSGKCTATHGTKQGIKKAYAGLSPRVSANSSFRPARTQADHQAQGQSLLRFVKRMPVFKKHTDSGFSFSQHMVKAIFLATGRRDTFQCFDAVLNQQNNVMRFLHNNPP